MLLHTYLINLTWYNAKTPLPLLLLLHLQFSRGGKSDVNSVFLSRGLHRESSKAQTATVFGKSLNPPCKSSNPCMGAVNSSIIWKIEDKHTYSELTGFTKCFSSLWLRDWETQYEMNTGVEKQMLLHTSSRKSRKENKTQP